MSSEYISDKKSDTIGYKCSECGAPMEYDPNTVSLRCNHCGSIQKIDLSDDVKERDFSELFETHEWRGDIKTVQCQNCGAREVLRGSEISTTCPFCGSNSVLESYEVDGIKPDTAIPFKISEKRARLKCLAWIKARFFSPSKFKKDAKINSVKGCYCPVWTFDCDTVATYSGRLGRHYTETYMVNGKTYTRTKVKYFDVSGSMDKVFDDIYIKGSDVVNDNYLQKIQPFDMNEYVKYDDKLLAGFSANHYTLDPLDAWKQAENRVRQNFQQSIVSRHNADEVVYLHITLTHRSRSFKYLMLPVYISAVNYNNKLYNQYINGVSGKVRGSVPKSPVKIGLTVLLGIALLAGLFLLITM